MAKKIIILFAVFLSLIFLNYLIIGKLYAETTQTEAVMKILAEIEEDNNNSKQFSYSSAPFASGPFNTDIKLSDGRAANLKSFFRKHNSPLYNYADKIVEVSDKYKFDYRLLPAIAMQESTLCRAIPPGSHNCWGWGIYGNNVIRFTSYDEAIDTVANGIKEQYLDKGLTTASKIMAKYTPSSNGSWAHAVNTFLKALE